MSEPDRSEAEAFLADMLLIYPVLGLQAFQKAEEQPSSTARLFLSGKDAKAEGTETPDGFVVYSGSLARAESVPSIHAYGLQLRDALVEQGLLVPAGNHLRLPTTTFSPRPPRRPWSSWAGRRTAGSSGRQLAA